MDILSVIGIVLAFVAMIGGSILKGSGVKALLGGAAFVIVVIGTFAAILLQTPMATFKRAMKIAGWVFKPPVSDAEAVIAKIVEWSNTARKQGLLGLESAVEGEKDEFMKKGLQALVDGGEPDAIRNQLEIELETREHADTAAAKVFEGMGIYAPTLGIIGAVMGLMAVMQNLADPSKLGHGIAAAFIATLYGIGIANLFMLPMASKLKSVIHAQTQVRQMCIEGIISIAQGENPRNIESKLKSYLHH
jgi:chemotaxis protein MotA